MDTQTDLTVLDHIVVVHLGIHIWSARKKLSPVDLGNPDLPPEDLASLGSKKICDPEELRIFGTLKARAVNLLDRIGVRFLSGWAIPEARLAEAADGLAVVRDEFDREKEAFLGRYDRSIQDWIAKHPQWSGIIAGSVVSESYVRSKMDFRWQAFKVTTPGEDNALQDSLRNDVSGLGGALFAEVAQAATETWHRCYAGKTEITRKALSPLKTIHDKLLGLTFVEPRVQPVAELLETAFKSIPRRGVIKGGTLVMLQGLVALLRNPEALLEHGQMILDGNKRAGDVLDSFLQDLTVAVDVAEFIAESETAELPETDTDGETGSASEITTPPVIESHGLW